MRNMKTECLKHWTLAKMALHFVCYYYLMERAYSKKIFFNKPFLFNLLRFFSVQFFFSVFHNLFNKTISWLLISFIRAIFSLLLVWDGKIECTSVWNRFQMQTENKHYYDNKNSVQKIIHLKMWSFDQARIPDCNFVYENFF